MCLSTTAARDFRLAMGFDGIDPEATGRPAYHPAVLLKIYRCGPGTESSQPAPRAGAQRNLELMCLTGRLMPDIKTIAHFRKDNGKAIPFSISSVFFPYGPHCCLRDQVLTCRVLLQITCAMPSSARIPP